jgi:hypothetical protein
MANKKFEVINLFGKLSVAHKSVEDRNVIFFCYLS